MVSCSTAMIIQINLLKRLMMPLSSTENFLQFQELSRTNALFLK